LKTEATDERLKSTPTNRVSSFLLFSTVAVAPLPFGSTERWAIASWCIVLGLALIAASPRALRSGQLALLGLAGVVIVGYGLVLHEQLSSAPWFATPHPLWAEASKTLGFALQPSVSITRNQPFFRLGAPLAAMLAGICSFIVCADRERARQLLKVLAWSGAVYAIYGIGSFSVFPKTVLWREKQAYLDSLTGTFINRNHAAVYFGACSVVWLIFCCGSFRRRLSHGSSWKEVLYQLSAKIPREMIVAFAFLFICLTAMFMTRSRAGVVLSLAALVGAFGLFFQRYLPRRRSAAAAIIITFAALLLVLLPIMGAGVSRRFDVQGVADLPGRLETYRSTIKLIMDNPWFGTGLGTFTWAYPPYRSGNMVGIWDRAHNTLLELAAEMGLPMAGLVVLLWIIVFGVLIRGALIRRRDLAFPVAGISIGALAVLHSLIEFSLQIPALAILTFAVVGAGLAQSFGSSGKSESDGLSRGFSRGKRLAPPSVDTAICLLP
jgi:O-antigen ligase